IAPCITPSNARPTRPLAMNPSPLTPTHLASLTRALTAAAAARSGAGAASVKWKWRQTPPRQAAVLVPLVATPARPNDLHVLFTVRSARLRKHRGEVSFPGGMMDPTDATHYDAACREVWEELGISLPADAGGEALPSTLTLTSAPAETAPETKVGLLGALTPLPDKTLSICVHPYVSYLGTLHLERELKVNANEVAAVFTLPLAYLVQEANMRTAKPTSKRKLSLGRAIYWRVPEETVVYVAPEADRGEVGIKAVSKREFLDKYHLESAVDDVGHVSTGATQATPASPDDMDHMDVWGLTAFITKEFVAILQKEGVDKLLCDPAAAAHSKPAQPPPSSSNSSFSTAPSP
ncbi:NUDIX hydrolase domain-like protein, partial [Catenaria anguillulae PL171]